MASNDHQVRILVDGTDWLGEAELGIDPPEFFAQPALSSAGELLVRRCECGCVGCDDVTVEVNRCGDQVRWVDPGGSELSFAATKYDDAVLQAKNDFSWENTNRTAERLAASVLAGLVLNDGFHFQWASTRIRAGVLSLSFVENGVQKIVELEWDGRLPDSARTSALAFLEELGEQADRG